MRGRPREGRSLSWIPGRRREVRFGRASSYPHLHADTDRRTGSVLGERLPLNATDRLPTVSRFANLKGDIKCRCLHHAVACERLPSPASSGECRRTGWNRRRWRRTGSGGNANKPAPALARAPCRTPRYLALREKPLPQFRVEPIVTSETRERNGGERILP